MPTSWEKYVPCKRLVSDFLLGKDSFDRQCLSVAPLIFCVTDFVSAIKESISLDLW